MSRNPIIRVWFVLAVAGCAGSVLAQDEWPTWRGPRGDGVARSGSPPTEWSEQKNIKWKVAVPGLGSSSPIVWKDRIYLTTAIDTKKTPDGKPAPEPGSGRRGINAKPTAIHDFFVVCLDRKDGREVWRRKVNSVLPHEGGHSTGTQASNSPITDGERLYAFFGSRGMHCLDLDGKVLWSKDLGRMKTMFRFGEGASPTLYGDALIVNWDHQGDSFLAALNKKTGDELWRKDRNEGTTWASPVVAEVDGKPQIIVAGVKASRAYDLKSGDLIWSCKGQARSIVPTPILHDGRVILMSWFMRGSLQVIRLSGAKGDLADSKHVEWTHSRNCPYVPSGLVYDGRLYFIRQNNGVLSCLEAKTGKVYYEGERLRGLKTVYASPVAAAGHVYVTSREGQTLVLKSGSTFERVALNELDDVFDASIAIVGDEMYLRGWKHLYCIAKTP
ncbi:MAG: hypothetical protein CMJ83_16885 [Planctomycetes bacterium]|nr:hypothetical protein [Planctomycetota bacterium]